MVGGLGAPVRGVGCYGYNGRMGVLEWLCLGRFNLLSYFPAVDVHGFGCNGNNGEGEEC